MAGKSKQPADHKLVIVESPVKAKTIEKFLGPGYKVLASNGHLIDLPKSKLGVDIENNFEPQYIVIRGRTSILKELKSEAAKSQGVLLATDPDREGEAISWHIAGALGLEPESQCRIEFNEVTKTAVTEAVKNPRTVDIGRVNAQQARRVLDRLVGYTLSPLLWKKVRRGLSAGRVQSVAVRLIVDREEEIRAFVPREYWTLTATLKEHSDKKTFEAKLWGVGGEKFEPANEEQATDIRNKAQNGEFTVTAIKTSQRSRKAPPPYTTSTLQQDANNKLGFSPNRTMRIAQGLYEGVKISATETVGLISYMRTDSTRISKEAQEAAKEEITRRFGADYAPEKPNVYAGRKNAQDAHEAIRPTYVKYDPDSIKDKLTLDQFKLYKMIYSRFMASQMTPYRFEATSYEIESGGCNFRATGAKPVFKGYTAIYRENAEEDAQSRLPSLEKGDVCDLIDLNSKQNFTSPPPRYTEGTLVKMLEEKGVGRPSTFATIASTILDRQYVKKEQKSLVPTELGEIVTNIMKEHFKDIVNVEFTAQMEEELDDIETDGKEWHSVMQEFYGPFEKEIEEADKNLEKVVIPDRPAGIICEKCGAEMVYKMGRFGEFIACPNYPECKNTKAIKKQIKTPCPLCGGELLQKQGKSGRTFYGCSNYPECSFVSWDMPIEENCTKCGAYMVLKRNRSGSTYKKCSNPECETNKRAPKKEEE